MSPASYLTAPPRVAGRSIARETANRYAAARPAEVGGRYTRERAYAGSRALTRNGAVAANPTAITSAPAAASKMK